MGDVGGSRRPDCEIRESVPEPAHVRGHALEEAAAAERPDGERPTLRSDRLVRRHEGGRKVLEARSVLAMVCVGGVVLASMYWDGSIRARSRSSSGVSLAESGSSGGDGGAFPAMPTLTMPAMPAGLLADVGKDPSMGEPGMASLPKLQPMLPLEKVVDLPDVTAPARATARQGGAGDRSGAAGAPSLAAVERGVAGRSGRAAGAASAPAIIAAARAAGGGAAGTLPARLAGLPVARVVPLAKVVPLAALAPRGVLDARGGGGRGGIVRMALQGEHHGGPIPVVSKVSSDADRMFKASGGDAITITGMHFGDDDSDRQVRIGGTLAERTEWLNSETLISYSPPGVGHYLDVEVAVSKDDGQEALVGVGRGLFAYTAPYIFNVAPWTPGHALEGPAKVYISAWGVGMWDTKPEAKINGHACGETTWVNNQTVLCTTTAGSRIALQNPEVVVGGQRSSCGVVVPGVCTVSVNTESMNSPEKLLKEIQEIKSHGLDASSLQKQLDEIAEKSEKDLRNDPQHPCSSWVVCKARTLLSSLSSAIMMMMAMASVCLLLIVLRPFTKWIQTEYMVDEEDMDFEEIADETDFLEQDFELRIHLR